MTTGPGAPQGCPHAHDDAAYVLGALSPVERLAFERHLDDCDACARSVRSFAGIPGLLDLVEPDVLADPLDDPAVPPTLLPSLTRAVRARRRRRTVVVAALAASVAAALALAVPAVLDGTPDPAPPSAATPRQPGDVATREMRPAGSVPVEASLDLESVTWGTRLVLTCTYDRDAIGGRLPERVPYLLYVTDSRGRSEQVGSWTSVSGATMTVPAATALDRDDIRDVEVRTSDGRVVLRLAS